MNPTFSKISLMVMGAKTKFQEESNIVCLRNGGSSSSFCPTVFELNSNAQNITLSINYNTYYALFKRYKINNMNGTLGGSTEKVALLKVINSLPSSAQNVAFGFCTDAVFQKISVIFVGGSENRGFLFLCFLYSFSSSAKGEKLDSLLNELKNSKEDSFKVNLLNAISWQSIMSNNIEQTKDIIEKTILLAKKLKYKSGEAKAINTLGVYYQSKSSFSESLKYCHLSFKLYEEIHNKKGIAFSYQSIGAIYSIQGNYLEANNNYEKTLVLYKEIKDKEDLSYIYNNYGGNYVAIGEYDEAMKSYEESLKLRIELGNIGSIAITKCEIAGIYLKKKEYKKVLIAYSKALQISELAGKKSLISKCYIGKAKINFHLKEYEVAKKDILIGQSYFNNESGYSETLFESYLIASKIDSALGNWKNAFINHNTYITYKDSFDSQLSNRKFLQTQLKYEFENKEALLKAEQDKKEIQSNEEIKLQRNIINSILIGLLGVLFFLVLAIKQSKILKKEKKRSDELLLNILPANVAEELKEKGSAEAKQFDNVTVIFTDFVNFTGISQQMSPGDLVAEIHKIFTAFDYIIERNGLEKIKTIGDAYLAVCGMPSKNEKHAVNTINAAKEIL